MIEQFLHGLSTRELHLMKILVKRFPISVSDAVLYTGAHWTSVNKSVKKLERMRLLRTEQRFDLPAHPTYIYPTKGTYHIAHLVEGLDKGIGEHKKQ